MDQRHAATEELKKHSTQILQNRAIAARGIAAEIAAASATSHFNNVATAPARVTVFSSLPFTPTVSGKVKITAVASGTFGGLDQNGTAQLVVDGSTLPVPVVDTNAGHAVATYATGIVSWIATVTKNVAHTFGIAMDAGAGNTASSQPGQLSVVIEELPG